MRPGNEPDATSPRPRERGLAQMSERPEVAATSQASGSCISAGADTAVERRAQVLPSQSPVWLSGASSVLRPLAMPDDLEIDQPRAVLCPMAAVGSCARHRVPGTFPAQPMPHPLSVLAYIAVVVQYLSATKAQMNRMLSE